MKRPPNFLISAAGETTGDLAITRGCWARGRLCDDVRDDYMLIEVDPPVIGQTYGLGGQDITNLIISAHLQGSTLFPVSEWPCPVYIARILDPSIVETLRFKKDQVELIAWGPIFPELDEAASRAGPLPHRVP